MLVGPRSFALLQDICISSAGLAELLPACRKFVIPTDRATARKYETRTGKYATTACKYETRTGKYATTARKYETRTGKYATRPGKHGTPARKYETRTGKHGTPARKYETRPGKHTTPARKYETRTGKHTTPLARIKIAPAQTELPTALVAQHLPRNLYLVPCTLYLTYIMTPDHYTSIESPSVAEFKDRSSKFIAYAYPVADGMHSKKNWQ